MHQPHYDAVVEYMWLKFGCKPKDIPEQFLSRAGRFHMLSEEFRHVAWLMNQPENVGLAFNEPLDWLLGKHGYTMYSIKLTRRLDSVQSTTHE